MYINPIYYYMAYAQEHPITVAEISAKHTQFRIHIPVWLKKDDTPIIHHAIPLRDPMANQAARDKENR